MSKFNNGDELRCKANSLYELIYVGVNPADNTEFIGLNRVGNLVREEFEDFERQPKFVTKHLGYKKSSNHHVIRLNRGS